MFVFILLLSAVAFAETTPTVRLNQSVAFADDMQFENLDLAIERQLASFATLGLPGTIKFGSKTYPKSVLQESLLLLKDISNSAKNCLKTIPANLCMDQFN